MATPPLTRLGLTADADLVHRMLTAHGGRSGGQLASELGLDRVRVERALSALSESGLAHPMGTRARAWRASPASPPAVPPAPLAVPVARPDVVELGQDVRHLPGTVATRTRIRALASVARVEWLAINTEIQFTASALANTATASRSLVSRGVRIRSIGTHVPAPTLMVPYGGPRLPAATYRRIEAVTMKLIVVDRTVALFPVDPHQHERGFLEVSQPSVVRALAEAFERQWAARTPTENAVPPFVPSPRESAIIQLLAQGLTDTAMARTMRLSERSISSIVRSLMDRLGVANRFQLGLALGLLSAAPAPPGLLDGPSQPPA